MKREDLTCRQRKVLEALEGAGRTVLVLGGPGTGKTTVALWAGRVFLEERANAGDRVLFLTFSRAAVRQLLTKARGVLSGVGERVETSTFHGLAYRLVRGFGRYAGYGRSPAKIQSATRMKLFGESAELLTYDALLPAALSILAESNRIRGLLRERWPLVVCDEVQDTSLEQWQFLQEVSSGKVLLLGDANQMIYSWLPGISPERFREIRDSVDIEIELEALSHRDPSGAIPALAEAIMRRRFDDDAVRHAIDTGRLKVINGVDNGSHAELLPSLIEESRSAGWRSIGIFGHSNAGVSELADMLSDADIRHQLVGIPDAHAEALGAMSSLCSYSVGTASAQDVRDCLGLFLTSCERGPVPALALALAYGEELPSGLERNLAVLMASIRKAASGSVQDVASVAAKAWPGLRIAKGREAWRRAAAHFYRLVRPLAREEASEESINGITRVVEAATNQSLIDLDLVEHGGISLMNFYQTKGREADVVIHVFREDDYFGKETEPFENLGRLMYVSVSRARHRVVILLPPRPHALVEPLSRLPGVEGH